MNRPAIPIEIKRAVYVEAGHRCAIPACRAPSPLEIAHIAPWSDTATHEFDNLICLCANCHSRFDKSQDGFDRQTMLMYKKNLALVRNQYTDFENIIFEQLIQNNWSEIVLDDFYTPFLYYSLRDGILSQCESVTNNYANGRVLGPFVYRLTDKGLELIDALKHGRQVAG